LEQLAVSVPKAAQSLSISTRFCYDMVERGLLPSVRLGRRILIPVDALTALVHGDGPPSDTCDMADD
jgi:excisionase family DNA binding protein